MCLSSTSSSLLPSLSRSFFLRKGTCKFCASKVNFLFIINGKFRESEMRRNWNESCNFSFPILSASQPPSPSLKAPGVVLLVVLVRIVILQLYLFHHQQHKSSTGIPIHMKVVRHGHTSIITPFSSLLPGSRDWGGSRKSKHFTFHYFYYFAVLHIIIIIIIIPALINEGEVASRKKDFLLRVRTNKIKSTFESLKNNFH